MRKPLHLLLTLTNLFFSTPNRNPTALSITLYRRENVLVPNSRLLLLTFDFFRSPRSLVPRFSARHRVLPGVPEHTLLIRCIRPANPPLDSRITENIVLFFQSKPPQAIFLSDGNATERAGDYGSLNTLEALAQRLVLLPYTPFRTVFFVVVVSPSFPTSPTYSPRSRLSP